MVKSSGYSGNLRNFASILQQGEFLEMVPKFFHSIFSFELYCMLILRKKGARVPKDPPGYAPFIVRTKIRNLFNSLSVNNFHTSTRKLLSFMAKSRLSMSRNICIINYKDLKVSQFIQSSNKS